MNEQDVDFLIELGDFKDQNINRMKKPCDSLETIESEFKAI